MNDAVRDVRWVVIHHPGPAWQPGLPLTQQLGVREHAQHYAQWLQAGKLALGGPFLDVTGGGMMLCQPGVDEAEARRFAQADPTVQSGLLSFELRPWLLGMQAAAPAPAPTPAPPPAP